MTASELANALLNNTSEEESDESTAEVDKNWRTGERSFSASDANPNKPDSVGDLADDMHVGHAQGAELYVELSVEEFDAQLARIRAIHVSMKYKSRFLCEYAHGSSLSIFHLFIKHHSRERE